MSKATSGLYLWYTVINHMPMYLLLIEHLLAEALLDFVYFPIWWYSAGTLRAAKACVGYFQSGNARLAPGLWLQNIFVPMFGQYDWQGRIISFIMRVAQIIGRSLALLVWLGVCLALFFAWLVFPIFVVWQLAQAVTRAH